MRALDLIYAKRQGQPLDRQQIEWLIAEYSSDRIPDYQIAAWLMAVFFQGMDAEETACLTQAMMRSGEIYDWSTLPGPKADKHSTGGVGDKVSLILAPLAAACGLVVPMVSGRGLGHTGGTLDKLEAIPGFNVHLTKPRIRRSLRKIGVAMIGQSDRFVPADKRLYALRDVTATVESIPLIAASIMSKKLAEGADSLVLDIKVGNGAFMKDLPSARTLGKAMIDLGRAMDRKVAALLTTMDQPTGTAIGHVNEVIESIETLQGHGPEDLWTITEALTATMLTLSGLAPDAKTAKKQIREAIASGAALEKFRQLIQAQNGDPRVVDAPSRLKQAPGRTVVEAPRKGWIKSIDTRELGLILNALGGGRRVKTDPVDHGVGLMIHAKSGRRVAKNEPLATLIHRNKTDIEPLKIRTAACFTLSDKPTTPLKIILGRLG